MTENFFLENKRFERRKYLNINIIYTFQNTQDIVSLDNEKKNTLYKTHY